MAGTYQQWEMGSNVSFGVGLIGMEDFKENIKRVFGQISGPVMKEALMAGAKIMARELQAATPRGRLEYTYRSKKTGKMVTIRSRRPIGQAQNAVIIYERQTRELMESLNEARPLLIGYEKEHAYYMYWYEYGTRWQAARPFARMVFDFTEEEALAAIERVISDWLGKAA